MSAKDPSPDVDHDIELALPPNVPFYGTVSVSQIVLSLPALTVAEGSTIILKVTESPIQPFNSGVTSMLAETLPVPLRGLVEVNHGMLPKPEALGIPILTEFIAGVALQL